MGNIYGTNFISYCKIYATVWFVPCILKVFLIDWVKSDVSGFSILSFHFVYLGGFSRTAPDSEWVQCAQKDI